MQNQKPDLHILGHWSYPTGPDAKRTVKTIYVIANTESVELFVNGRSVGVNSKAESGYIFSFPHIEFAPGRLKAVGRNGGKPVAQAELATCGPPMALRMTPITGPQGLQA